MTKQYNYPWKRLFRYGLKFFKGACNYLLKVELRLRPDINKNTVFIYVNYLTYNVTNRKHIKYNKLN